ncbi:MAG: type secretion protein ImpA [Rhodoferax sp.]|nr:type secretion protein ImpA [Rhodoferax sp.]
MQRLPNALTVNSPAIPMVAGLPALQPVRLSGQEGLNSLFEYELLLKTPDDLNLGANGAADFNLDDFLGREITCTIELDGSGEMVAGAVGASTDHLGAGVRQINALITDAAVWGEEGRHVQYKLTLRPWLHLATLSTDCKIFQNQTVVQILDELLADYAFPVDKRLFDTYPPRDFQTQFNESDFAFFERLCQEWGISYHFSHSEGGHRLVLSDAMGSFGPNDSAAYQNVTYHAPGWKTDAEYISSFVPAAHLTSGQYATRDYDYTRPRADLSASRQEPRSTGQADGEVYQWHASGPGAAGSHYAQPRAGPGESNDPAEEGRRFALLRMEALRTHGERAQASGSLRGMVPGCTFRLQAHPRQNANAEYLILQTRFVIEDVAQDSQRKDAAHDRQQHWQVQVDFTAHPVTQPLRPAHSRARPSTGGPQPALVVGPEGQNIWTDALGRIKVQFPWDRIGQKNQHATCWLRVSSPWAGNQLGGMHLPRIGQEVVVDFYGGDPDLPICTGRVHNQMNLPPWDLPSQGALSGFRSRELTADGGNSAAGRSNHLLMDDTAGQIQAQLKSDHQSSSLSLGSITRVEDNAGRKDPRGEGFELRTDAHGVMRAMAGLLISTEARAHAQAHTTDMGETVARLTQGRSLHENLGDAARQAQAQDLGDQDEVARALRAQVASIKGATQAGSAAGKFPEFADPHLVIASPAGIESTSAQSTHLHAGEHIALTSEAHASLSAGRSVLVSAKKAIRLFAYEAGARLFAFGGDIEIKALKNSIAILAKLNITQTAETIDICANKKLTLNGGGSTITLDAGGIVQATGGPHRVFAATHSMVGPKNGPTRAVDGTSSLKELPPGQLMIAMRSHGADGWPLANEPYTLYRDGAVVEKGITDAAGQIHIDKHVPGSVAKYRVVMHQGQAYDIPVHGAFEGANAAALKRASQGHRDAGERP